MALFESLREFSIRRKAVKLSQFLTLDHDTKKMENCNYMVSNQILLCYSKFPTCIFIFLELEEVSEPLHSRILLDVFEGAIENFSVCRKKTHLMSCLKK